MLFGDVDKLRRTVRDKVVVEIGTARGLSAMVMALNAKKVYTIDNYFKPKFGVDQETEERREELPSQDMPDIIRKYLKFFNPRIEFIHDSSLSASKRFNSDSIDIVFIDGDHTSAGVRADYECWLPKVKSGGIVFFHDYSLVFPHIKEYIDEELRNDNRVRWHEIKSKYSNVIASFKKL